MYLLNLYSLINNFPLKRNVHATNTSGLRRLNLLARDVTQSDKHMVKYTYKGWRGTGK